MTYNRSDRLKIQSALQELDNIKIKLKETKEKYMKESNENDISKEYYAEKENSDTTNELQDINMEYEKDMALINKELKIINEYFAPKENYEDEISVMENFSIIGLGKGVQRLCNKLKNFKKERFSLHPKVKEKFSARDQNITKSLQKQIFIKFVSIIVFAILFIWSYYLLMLKWKTVKRTHRNIIIFFILFNILMPTPLLLILVILMLYNL